MNNNELLKAGYDPGFNANKIARIVGDEIETYVMPSSVGLANRRRKDGLTLGGVVRPYRSTRQPFRVVFDGLEYLVGPNVDAFTQPIDRMDFDRFTDSPELRAALYAGLYRLVNGGAHQLALAIALPVEILQDNSEAVRVERAMRRWLVGEHLFSVDGVETVLTISRIRAKIPQPVATWFDWGMNQRGEWIRGREAMRSPTLIVDEGFNTLDVLLVENGQISHRFSGGDTLGMRRAAERLIETIGHRYDCTVELHKANQLIQAAINGQKAELYVRGELTEVTPEAKQAISSLEADVDNFLDRSVGKARNTYRVLLTGGGALALSARLLRRFPEATVIYEPVLANARGLAKLAVRPGFLN